MNTHSAVWVDGGTSALTATAVTLGRTCGALSPNGHISCHRAPHAGAGHVWVGEWCADRREREVAA